MEDTGEFNDTELEERQERYPQYDDMDYHDLLSNFDELTNRLQREVKYGSDPLVATDINRELNYVKSEWRNLEQSKQLSLRGKKEP
jgi:transposase